VRLVTSRAWIFRFELVPASDVRLAIHVPLEMIGSTSPFDLVTDESHLQRARRLTFNPPAKPQNDLTMTNPVPQITLATSANATVQPEARSINPATPAALAMRIRLATLSQTPRRNSRRPSTQRSLDGERRIPHENQLRCY